VQRGFAPNPTTAPGHTRLEWRGGCAAVGRAWRDVPELYSATSLAAVAAQPDERGPMVMYLEFDRAADVRPRDWTSVERRGFYVSAFTPQDSDDATQLAQDAADDGLSPDSLDDVARVVRLEIFRTPVSAEALVVDLGVNPRRVRARVTGEMGPGTYALCAAYPDAAAIRPIARVGRR
jgi:hypothetical protein